MISTLQLDSTDELKALVNRDADQIIKVTVDNRIGYNFIESFLIHEMKFVTSIEQNMKSMYSKKELLSFAAN